MIRQPRTGQDRTPAQNTGLKAVTSDDRALLALIAAGDRQAVTGEVMMTAREESRLRLYEAGLVSRSRGAGVHYDATAFGLQFLACANCVGSIDVAAVKAMAACGGGTRGLQGNDGGAR